LKRKAERDKRQNNGRKEREKRGKREEELIEI
jgi:hypothetical protein